MSLSVFQCCKTINQHPWAETAVFQCESMVDYKHCQIMKTEAGQFTLCGAKKSCGSIRELLQCYQKEALRTDGYTFQLTRCCPPSLKGQRLHACSPKSYLP